MTDLDRIFALLALAAIAAADATAQIPDNLTITSATPPPFVANKTIVTSGSVTVNGSTNVVYQAGNQITLQPGFTATAGASTTFKTILTAGGLPTVSQNPSNVSVTTGASVSFTSTANGIPAPTVKWQVSVASGPFSDISGATATTLSLTAAYSDSGKQYRAVFTNSYGSVASNPARLTVNSPGSFTLTAATNIVVQAGDTTGSTSFTITPSGGFAGSVAVAPANQQSWPVGLSILYDSNPASVSSPTSFKLSPRTAANTPPGTYTLGFTGTSGAVVQSTSFQLTVVQPLTSLCNVTPSEFTVGQTLTFNGYPSGGMPPYTYAWQTTASNTTAITVNTLAQTPYGEFFRVQDILGHAVQSGTCSAVPVSNADFNLSLTPEQTITAGTSGSVQVTVAGVAGYNFSQWPVSISFTNQGTWPTGIGASFGAGTISPGSPVTATISTLPATVSGAYLLNFSATSGIAQHQGSIRVNVQGTAQDFTVSLNTSGQHAAPGGTGRFLVTIGALGGFGGNVNITVAGYPQGATAQFSQNTVTGSGASTLKIAVPLGTPTGSYPLTITATGPSASHTTSGTLVVGGTTATPLQITTSSLQDGQVGVPYLQQLTAAGGTPGYTWSLAIGTLPNGLTLSTDGVINGTPVSAVAATQLALEVTDSAGLSASQSFVLSVGNGGPLTIFGTNDPLANPKSTFWLPSASVGKQYWVKLGATGGTPPYTFSVVPTGNQPPGIVLPPGLSLVQNPYFSDPNTTDSIYGTPTNDDFCAPVSFTVTDNSVPQQTASSLWVFKTTGRTTQQPLTLVGSWALPDAPLNSTTYGQTVPVSVQVSGGTGQYQWSANGSSCAGFESSAPLWLSKPSWLAVAQNGTLSIDTVNAPSGPTIPGPYGVWLQVTDTGNGNVQSQYFNINVPPSTTPASITPTALEVNLGYVPIDSYLSANADPTNGRPLVAGAGCDQTITVQECYHRMISSGPHNWVSQGVTGVRFFAGILGGYFSTAYPSANCADPCLSSMWTANVSAFFNDLKSWGIRRITPTITPGANDGTGLIGAAVVNACGSYSLDFWPTLPYGLEPVTGNPDRVCGQDSYNSSPVNPIFWGWDKYINMMDAVLGLAANAGLLIDDFDYFNELHVNEFTVQARVIYDNKTGRDVMHELEQKMANQVSTPCAPPYRRLDQRPHSRRDKPDSAATPFTGTRLSL